jgi:hypothetical protein
MDMRKMATWGLILLTNQFVSQRALADASYQSTTQITGGTLVDALKGQAFIAKSVNKMFAPTNTLTMVHGNQKATVSKESTEIIDLDQGAITHIDMVKKTYTVVTFAQMRQAMANMPKQMQQAQTQMQQAQAQMKQAQSQMPQSDLKTSFDVKVNNTGVSKVVNGLMAQEQLITMSMHITDPNAAPTAAVTEMAYTVTTDVWIAPDPPAVKEIQDFDLRMGKKMMEGVDLSAFAASMKANANAGMMGLFGNQPGAADAMVQMGKEMAKLKGTHVMEVTSMGGSGTGPGVAATTPAASPAPPPPTGQSVAGQVATDTATQTASSETSRMGNFGSALGGSVIGAFRRKKAAPAPAPAASVPATTQTAAGGTPTTTSAVLMETTTQETNFSQEPVPTSVFEVPRGFTKVPSAYERMNN